DMAFSGTIDDELDADAEKVVAKLKALAQLSNDKPNRHRIATDAVRWHAGIDSSSGGSGFGSIEMSHEGITGRPAFPVFTQQNIPVKAGQHRRHILAWHTMREFVTKAYAVQRNAVIIPMRNAFSTPPDPVSAFALTEAFQHVVSGRQKTGAGAGDLTDEEV